MSEKLMTPAEIERAVKETCAKDAQDAARYRWLRDRLAIEDIEHLVSEFFGTPDEDESLKTDSAVDSAMSAAPEVK